MIAIFPEIVAAAAKGDVERLAVLARKYFGAGDAYAPRLDVQALLVYAGVEVEALPLETPGALVAKDERGAFKIVAIVGTHRDEAETRFLLAHMLGHVMLDILPVIARGDWQVSGLREVASPLKRYGQGGVDQMPGQGAGPEARREELADRFAAALIMPLGMVRRAHEKFQDVAKTAAFFGVPRACLERRLVDIGVVLSDPVNFLDAERKLGGSAQGTGHSHAFGHGNGHGQGGASDHGDENRSGLSAPEPSMPRSYAASTYGQTERSTRRAGKSSPEEAPSAAKSTKAGKTPPRSAGQAASEAAPAPVSPKGMDRLRELAKRLDKAPR